VGGYPEHNRSSSGEKVFLSRIQAGSITTARWLSSTILAGVTQRVRVIRPASRPTWQLFLRQAQGGSDGATGQAHSSAYRGACAPGTPGATPIPPAPPVTANTINNTDDINAIRRVLDGYKSAYDTKDLAKLQELWPRYES